VALQLFSIHSIHSVNLLGLLDLCTYCCDCSIRVFQYEFNKPKSGLTGPRALPQSLV